MPITTLKPMAGTKAPLWVRGSDSKGLYHRQPLKSRDWHEAIKRMPALDATGEGPKLPALKDIVETLRIKFLAIVEKENLNPETIRKYRLLFSQMETFAKLKPPGAGVYTIGAPW